MTAPLTDERLDALEELLRDQRSNWCMPEVAAALTQLRARLAAAEGDARDRRGLLLELREQFTEPVGHYSCEDPWYSCPLSVDGCADDRKTECDCGQAEHSKKHADYVARIDAALAPPAPDAEQP